MMGLLPVVVLAVACLLGGSECFRVDLEGPRYVLRGRSAKLICNHGVERRLLHKVEWLRDGERKLFQFVRGRNPPYRNFTVPGAMLDWAQSNERHITLRKLDLDACGVYSCEVSMETPIYTKPSNEILLTVIQPQTSDPEIWGRKTSYLVGEKLEINCTSSPSHPPAHITWLVNERQVSEQYVRVYHSHHKTHLSHRHHSHHHRLQTADEMDDVNEDLMDHEFPPEPVAYPSIARVPSSATVGLAMPIAMHHARLGLGAGGRLRVTCVTTLPSFRHPHPNGVEFNDKRTTSISVDILMPMQEEEDEEEYPEPSSSFHSKPSRLIALVSVVVCLLTLLDWSANPALSSIRQNVNQCHTQPRR
ncbi:uncharacterized protein LOC124157724 [Ischnura elegans]|uniref:uncharacterized protein LOC124157724 n=1 Tax=Ischnura elegans TaxID=197161 RepID=UPI001ED8925F|nr:uncharacterized protein LOC124157724 [Ischnura elegans]